MESCFQHGPCEALEHHASVTDGPQSDESLLDDATFDIVRELHGAWSSKASVSAYASIRDAILAKRDLVDTWITTVTSVARIAFPQGLDSDPEWNELFALAKRAELGDDDGCRNRKQRYNEANRQRNFALVAALWSPEVMYYYQWHVASQALMNLLRACAIRYPHFTSEFRPRLNHVLLERHCLGIVSNKAKTLCEAPLQPRRDFSLVLSCSNSLDPAVELQWTTSQNGHLSIDDHGTLLSAARPHHFHLYMLQKDRYGLLVARTDPPTLPSPQSGVELPVSPPPTANVSQFSTASSVVSEPPANRGQFRSPTPMECEMEDDSQSDSQSSNEDDDDDDSDSDDNENENDQNEDENDANDVLSDSPRIEHNAASAASGTPFSDITTPSNQSFSPQALEWNMDESTTLSPYISPHMTRLSNTPFYEPPSTPGTSKIPNAARTSMQERSTSTGSEHCSPRTVEWDMADPATAEAYAVLKNTLQTFADSMHDNESGDYPEANHASDMQESGQVLSLTDFEGGFEQLDLRACTIYETLTELRNRSSVSETKEFGGVLSIHSEPNSVGRRDSSHHSVDHRLEALHDHGDDSHSLLHQRPSMLRTLSSYPMPSTHLLPALILSSPAVRTTSRLTVEEHLHNRYRDTIVAYILDDAKSRDDEYHHELRSQWLHLNTSWAIVFTPSGSKLAPGRARSANEADVVFMSSIDFVTTSLEGQLFQKPVIIKEGFTDSGMHTTRTLALELQQLSDATTIQTTTFDYEQRDTVSIGIVERYIKGTQQGSRPKVLTFPNLTKSHRPLFTMLPRFRLLDHLIERARRVSANREQANTIDEISSSINFNVFGMPGAFSGARRSAINGTWIRILEGVSFWTIVSEHDADGNWEQHDNLDEDWELNGRAKFFILEQDDVLFIPPGVKVVYAIHSPVRCLMEGGIVWDDADIFSTLSSVLWTSTIQPDVQEPCLRHVPRLVVELASVVKQQLDRFRGDHSHDELLDILEQVMTATHAR
ncbi:Hypothetical protein R9X50_00274300 [Acrodontium crateriforme]|uniref:Uncharacterized protein n=1 Tax=Acrodontium crateriforme TaxID=150365 RepID=A0AAQ3RB86_9PEZI|nr:Hypothetical protein R9X50_00274300 [Acrodontium crateriforme]